ncbi:DUF397 domain-containing protein [Streptomyces sp. NPDC046887]|uniref:DUF397 domain-containing protein n=1 Tax=Streptomyces sp. NPDC046887 TaxID=3155472 RepID=UPI0033F67900
MSHFNFHKSTYSTITGECVEVAVNIPHTVAIRDSKRPGGPLLRITPTAWKAFRTHMRGEPGCGGGPLFRPPA